MPPAEFRALAERLKAARGNVRLAQFSTSWVADDDATALRDRIDDLLLQRFLLDPTALRVKRIMLYDLPEASRSGAPGDRHREWVERLRRDLAYLGAGRSEAPIRYEIWQRVLATAGRASRPPAEIASLGEDQRFDELWGNTGFRILPGETTAAGLYADHDPLYHLDLDVRDTDRLQIGPEQRQRPAARDPEAEI